MITVKEVQSKKDLRTFVKFPFDLYKDSENWIPPIINQEMKTFNKSLNPVFENADAYFFLAFKDTEVVGRVTAIINWLEVNGKNIKKMRFGWFDFIDDLAVSKALLGKVEEIGRQNGLTFMEGPVGFSNLDKVGVMTEGFEYPGSMITWYNHPYYVDHFEKHGFTVEKRYQESHFYFDDIKPETFLKAQELIKRRYKLECLNFKSTKEIMAYTDDMFKVFTKSHATLSSFVEINEKQREYFKKKFVKFLNPEYVKFVVNEAGELIAFAIITPSYANALKKINGRIFPFGIRHLLRAKKHNEKAVFYLIGILPEYQNKGVTAIIFNEFYKEVKKKKVKEFIRGPELEDNIAIQQIWKHFNPVIFKRRCTYRKAIQ
ncbi:MAG: GTP cyclohydrolase [Flavobacteriaceae bacterium]|nr:GTP cyclohydrolase [Bacteroidia bacterium]MBT8286720.1 GTP cyclohydrolase [Bacteroidia bacterium]NNF75368.1 GTP cyclohydrolase [Flavobacteriaceae bacterium]NNK73516.1 GTP cyclohydrolase [Flavobacteriaceae bacterium]